MKWQFGLFVLGAVTPKVLGDTINCDLGKKNAATGTIKEGIKYLNGLDGHPTARPGDCNRVSCSYKSAIWVCSDDGKEHPLKSWKTVGDVTQKIVDKCSHAEGLGGDVVQGSLTAPNGWGVIVHDGNC